MKILIVEDEALLAEGLRTLLELRSFEVEVVTDGENGAEYAETGVYDLLILDVETFEDVIYKFGRNHVQTVIKKGQVVVQDGRVLEPQKEA